MLCLGSISFINSLPVDLALMRGIVPSHTEILSGSPAFLNAKIIEGRLDISPVSAFFYAQHQRELILLPDLSISSESGVQSVLLFSRYPIKELGGRSIGWTGEGRTTPALLEILCRQRYGFEPQLEPASNLNHGIPENFDAMLLIGDKALIAKQRYAGPGLHIVDLAEQWEEWTKRPLVFAVWAARRDRFLNDPETFFEAHRALLKSKEWGLLHLDEIIEEAGSKTELPAPALRSYFSHLSYDFDERLKDGMKFYFEQASKCGLIKPLQELEDITQMAGTPHDGN